MGADLKRRCRKVVMSRKNDYFGGGGENVHQNPLHIGRGCALS